MSLLEVTGLSHAYGDKILYKNASLVLNKAEHMGIVGANGAGKSTLVKILTGEVIPDAGRIKWQSGITLGHLDQYARTGGADTLFEYLKTAFAPLYEIENKLTALYEKMARSADENLLRRAALYQDILNHGDFYTLETAVAKVAEGLGLTALGMDRKVSELSGGQREKAILAKLLLEKPDVLLLDEPTNFLDSEHVSWLAGYLSDFEGGYLVVSHDYDFLDAVTNCIGDIALHTIEKYRGSFTHFVRQKDQRREDYARMYAAQQKEVKKLEQYIEKNKARASTAGMARSRQKKLDKIERLTPPDTGPDPVIRLSLRPLSVARALTVESLEVGYDGPLLPRISFSLAGGQKAAVIGFNGIAKTTLLKTLMGLIPMISGSFAFDRHARIAYYEQEPPWPDDSITPIGFIREQYPRLSEKEIRSQLSRCGVRREHAMHSLSTLSGGECAKVRLCALVLAGGNFLILDEPTNHLDAKTKEALRLALREFPGSLILVSHEPSFYDGLVDKVIDIEKLIR